PVSNSRPCGSTPFEYRARDFTVVEMNAFRAQDLVILVPFPRNQHDIPGARHRDALANGLRTVQEQAVVLRTGLPDAPNPDLDVQQDLLGILGSGVVGGDDGVIRQFTRRPTHLGALPPVAVSAA